MKKIQIDIFNKISISQILTEVQIKTNIFSSKNTYQDLANYFEQNSVAIGILIINENQIMGMISRQRWWQWKSQTQKWQQVKKKSFSTCKEWWLQAQDYLLIDQDYSIDEAINRINKRSLFDVYEPVVVKSNFKIGLINVYDLWQIYFRLLQPKIAKQTNVELANLRRQHQLILNSIGEGVYGLDSQGNTTFVNPAAAKMIGWDIKDLIGKSMHTVLHHSHADNTSYPREQCPIYAAFKDGIVHRVEDEVFWRKDGSNFPVEYISTPIHDEQGKLVGAVVTFRDITQRKWSETILQRANEELELKVQERTAELSQANEQLKELSELRSRFVSMVCHEFRNPLNNIAFSISFLKRYDSKLSLEEKFDYLSGMEVNVNRMTQMIDELLVIGKIDTEKIIIKPVVINLVEFCQNLIEEFQTSLTNKTIEFASDRLKIIAETDPNLLHAILTNIISNSIKYSPNDSAIAFKLACQNNEIIFTISDRGLGIPPQDLKHIFEPFQRGKNVSNIPGTGLGLNIVKRFVELLQGKLTIDSEVGVGTTVTVQIPLKVS
ncbi:two-component sensor histidine kinase [Stanieria sp. NIES-3757]|nr:two-component sensor histidine kinase [Stanieria sp. NIES-3757]